MEMHPNPLRSKSSGACTASRETPAPGFERRLGYLQAIEHMLMKHKEDWLNAVHEDFGGRSKHETMLTEFLMVMNSIKHTRKHLRDG